MVITPKRLKLQSCGWSHLKDNCLGFKTGPIPAPWLNRFRSYKPNKVTQLLRHGKNQPAYFSIFSIKNTCCRYRGNLKFYMKVSGHESQYRTKFQDNAANIWEARNKKWVISAYFSINTVLKNNFPNRIFVSFYGLMEEGLP